MVLILKLLTVLFFLLMFLRGSRLVWGVGLLTVTTAVLLDALLGTFGRQEMLDQLGFFYYVIVGWLVGGAALWLWGLLRPTTNDRRRRSAVSRQPSAISHQPATHQSHDQSPISNPQSPASAVFDRQMLFDQMRERLGYQDVLDVIFDLGLSENEVVALNGAMPQTLVNIINAAEAQGHGGALALAVERVLTPPTPDKLPRLEKLSIESPPTVLRHFLLAHYSLEQLGAMAAELGLDWEQMGGGGKREKVRELLLYLRRRGRLGELVGLMQS